MSPTGAVDVTVRLDALYPEAKQDLRDGAALRRLREALTKEPWGRHWHVTFEPAYEGGWQVSVGTYDTFAEAADRCRTALED